MRRESVELPTGAVVPEWYDSMLEVAIHALKIVLPEKAGADAW